VKAVVMAGGEGSRLRPLTANQPKPLLPVANRPIMEHVLRLLRRHGFDETVVTVQFLASMVRTHFGDGEDLGMHLTYATEATPLGTAGSVRNARQALHDDAFLVVSGDALTDIDLTELVRAHRRTGALVTVCLTRVPDPLEFGIVVQAEDGRVERFLEKPTWGQVFTDTVSTGIYVMEPEVFDHVAGDRPVDWSGEVFPALLAMGAPVYGHVAEGYWEDVGSLDSYIRASADVLHRRVEVEMPGFEMAPGIWVGEGVDLDPDAQLTGPLCLGNHVKVEGGARLEALTVLGDNVVVKGGAVLERAVVHDNAFIGSQVGLRGCVIGKNTDVMRGARIDESAVVGDDCVVEEEAYLAHGVQVYPFKTIEAGAVVRESVIWESRASATLFGPRGGVCGLVNVEITPGFVVRLASAFATTLPKGSVVVTSRDGSRAARALKRAVISALTASAIDVRDLEVAPLPVTRFSTRESDAAGGVVLRTSPGDPQSIDIVFLDDQGADLAPARQRGLERVFSRQEFRRAFPGEIAELVFPSRTVETYAQELLRTVDVSGLEQAQMKVVLDTAGGAVALVLPTLLGRLGIDVLTVNNRLSETADEQTEAERARDLTRLGELVSSSRAAFGVRFDSVGERLSLVDERGQLVSDDRALLVVLDLVAAERRGLRAALPVTTTRVAERVAGFHGTDVVWVSTAPAELTRAAAQPGVGFAGDGRGGFVVPEFSASLDAVAAFVRLLGLVARTRLTLSEIDARIPRTHVVTRSVPTPWAVKGAVMRTVLEAAGPLQVDTTDGVRVLEEDSSWVLVLPDPAEAATHLWAEAAEPAAAAALLERWVAVVQATGSASHA
jgi:mannose-1-phosphate guanylyltransferase/phosphomannomutase